MRRSALLSILFAHVVACGDDVPFEDEPDAAIEDVTFARREAGPLDLGFFEDGGESDGGPVTEAGIRDAAPPLDASAPDAGFGDFGVVTGIAEGESCTPNAADPQGDCRDDDAECHVWQASPQLATCVISCQVDADCASSAANSMCRNVGLRSDPVQICVAEEAEEDGRCSGSARFGQAMVGCRADLDCVASVLNLEADEGVCARVCNPLGADCNIGAYSYCNPQLVSTPQGMRGVCSPSQKPAGAVCLFDSLTRACDRDSSSSGNLECMSLPNMTTVSGEGICIETCDPDSPSCVHDGANAAASTCVPPDIGPACATDTECQTIGFDRCHPSSQVCVANLGFCADGCSNYPDDCLGTGSEGHGMTCFGPFNQDLDGNGAAVPLSFCIDVADPPSTETLLNWDGVMSLTNGVTGDPCTLAGTARHCPDHTTCFRSGSSGYCLRGCEIPTSSTCQGLSPTAVCVAIGPTQGLCAEPP